MFDSIGPGAPGAEDAAAAAAAAYQLSEAAAAAAADAEPNYEENNAFCITLFCIDQRFDSRSGDFLCEAFNRFPDKVRGAAPSHALPCPALPSSLALSCPAMPCPALPCHAPFAITHCC